MDVSLTSTLGEFSQDKTATDSYSSGRIQKLYNEIDEGLNDNSSLDGYSAMRKLMQKYE